MKPLQLFDDKIIEVENLFSEQLVLFVDLWFVHIIVVFINKNPLKLLDEGGVFKLRGFGVGVGSGEIDGFVNLSDMKIGVHWGVRVCFDLSGTGCDDACRMFYCIC